MPRRLLQCLLSLSGWKSSCRYGRNSQVSRTIGCIPQVSSLQSVPFELLLPVVLRYIAELQRCYSYSIYHFQRSLSTSVTASERCTCFSIGCSARHRNQVGALVIHLRPPVLLLSAAEALQSLYLWHIFSAATAPASVALPADSTKVKDPVVMYRHLSDASRAAIALLQPVAILSLQFLS